MPSVLLVREWEQQMSSSGCCGRLEGEFLRNGCGGQPLFSERRAEMESAGALYRALRRRHGSELSIQVLDPRNLLSLVPILLAEGRRHDIPLLERLRTLLGATVNMVVVNGRIVARNRWPSAEEVTEAIAERRDRGGRP